MGHANLHLHAHEHEAGLKTLRQDSTWSHCKWAKLTYIFMNLYENVSSRTCAKHCIHLSFTSIFASLVCVCQSEHALSQWPSQANSSIETKIVCGCRNARQSLSSVDVLWSSFWSRSLVYFVSVSSRACVDKMAELKSRDRSSSTESQL